MKGCKSSQCSLKKIRWRPFGPGHLRGAMAKRVARTSSIEGSFCKARLSSKVRREGELETEKRDDWMREVEKRSGKKFLPICLRIDWSEIRAPKLSTRAWIFPLNFLVLAIIWKYLVLKSEYLCQSMPAFWAEIVRSTLWMWFSSLRRSISIKENKEENRMERDFWMPSKRLKILLFCFSRLPNILRFQLKICCLKEWRPNKKSLSFRFQWLTKKEW